MRRKPAIGVAAAAAGVHHGGDAGADAAHVGVDPVAIDTLVHVGVQVDQAGRDISAAHLDHAGGLVGRDVGGDGGNFAVGYRDIVLAVQILRGIDYRAAFDKQVVHGWVPPYYRAAVSLVSGCGGVKFGICRYSFLQF